MKINRILLLLISTNLYACSSVTGSSSTAKPTISKVSANFCLNKQEEFVLCQDFTKSKMGKYNLQRLEEDWPLLDKDFPKVRINGITKNNEKVSIENLGNNKALKVTYLAGQFGGQNGASWPIKFKKPYQKLSLEYKLKFGNSFSFVDGSYKKAGGKLPGLCGGTCNSGHADTKNGLGWSARYMWAHNGSGLLYLYYVDMDNPKSNPIAFPKCVAKPEDYCKKLNNETFARERKISLNIG